MSSAPASWFGSEERIATLEFKAAAWLATPFFANGNTPGREGGVSCQKLVSAIYAATGFAHFNVPEVPMAHSRFNANSLVEEFMAGRPEFARLPETTMPVAGDLLGFRVHKIVHHLGIALHQGVFIHCCYGIGTVISALSDPTWQSRLAAIWRPLATKS